MGNSRTTNTITTETYRVILITNASQTLHCHRPPDGKHLSVWLEGDSEERFTTTVYSE